MLVQINNLLNMRLINIAGFGNRWVWINQGTPVDAAVIAQMIRLCGYGSDSEDEEFGP